MGAWKPQEGFALRRVGFPLSHSEAFWCFKKLNSLFLPELLRHALSLSSYAGTLVYSASSIFKHSYIFF